MFSLGKLLSLLQCGQWTEEDEAGGREIVHEVK
jgi:hypothetical protein